MTETGPGLVGPRADHGENWLTGRMVPPLAARDRTRAGRGLSNNLALYYFSAIWSSRGMCVFALPRVYVYGFLL